MGYFEEALGRAFCDGVELEIGAGRDYKSGIVATRNSSTQRIDVSGDPQYLYRESASYRGDDTVVPGTGSGTTALAIDGPSTTIDIGDIVAPNHIVECIAKTWIYPSTGAFVLDEFRFWIYRKSSDTSLYIGAYTGGAFDSDPATLAIESPYSAEYEVSGTYAGTLSIAAVNTLATQTYQLSLWVGKGKSI